MPGVYLRNSRALLTCAALYYYFFTHGRQIRGVYVISYILLCTPIHNIVMLYARGGPTAAVSTGRGNARLEHT